MIERECSDVGDRVVVLWGEINEESASKAALKLMELNLMSHDPIVFMINSPGGDVYNMLAVYDIIQACAAPIWTVGIGRVMSAATLLLACGQKGERRMSERTRALIHEVSGAMQGGLGFLKDNVAEYQFLCDEYINLLSKETKTAVPKWKKIIESGKNHFLSARECAKLGICDKLF